MQRMNETLQEPKVGSHFFQHRALVSLAPQVQCIASSPQCTAPIRVKPLALP